MANRMRILITGADGFVGNHLVRRLSSAAGDAEFVLFSRTPGALGAIQVDITDRDAVLRVVERCPPDVVYHLAGYASVAQSNAGQEECWNVNFVGSLNLACALAAHSPSARMLHVSSSEVYGRSFNEGLVTEDTPLAPLSVYARAKAATETMLGDVFPDTGKLIIARPFNHTGPGQDKRFVVPSFAHQLARTGQGGGEIRVGNLEAQREFLDVRDVVRAYTMLIDAAAELPCHSVFNVASGQAHKIADVLYRLKQLSGSNAPIVVDPAKLRPNDIPVASGSSRKLEDTVGWKPEIALDTTLADVVADARKSQS